MKKGKISRIFQKLEKGNRVAIVREASEKANFSKRLQGKSGTIEGKRGKAYIVKLKDNNKEKTFTIKPVHLRK